MKRTTTAIINHRIDLHYLHTRQLRSWAFFRMGVSRGRCTWDRFRQCQWRLGCSRRSAVSRKYVFHQGAAVLPTANVYIRTAPWSNCLSARDGRLPDSSWLSLGARDPAVRLNTASQAAPKPTRPLGRTGENYDRALDERCDRGSAIVPGQSPEALCQSLTRLAQIPIRSTSPREAASLRRMLAIV